MIAVLSRQIQTKISYKFFLNNAHTQLTNDEVETIATYALDYLQVAKHLSVVEVKPALTGAIARQYQHAYLLATINQKISDFKLAVILIIEGLLVKLQVMIEIETPNHSS